jgi:hypothetical protein
LLGYSGGAEWGGNAIDPDGIFYQNANEAFWNLQMISRAGWNKELASLSRGNALFITNCSACHGTDRKGSPGLYPDLTHVGAKHSQKTSPPSSKAATAKCQPSPPCRTKIARPSPDFCSGPGGQSRQKVNTHSR